MAGVNRQSILIGIGLLIVGLLGGVWLTLIGIQPRLSSDAPTEVRAVELPPVAPEPAVSSAGALADIATLNQAFKTVSSRVRPAVVFIEVTSGGGNNWFQRFDREGGQRQSVGSGVMITSDGYAVTNNHVVDGARTIKVTLSDKREFSAEVVGADAQTDLAVIRLDGAAGLPAARVGDSDKVQVGEWVLAVGNPFRLTSTVTAGIVSALGRQVNIIDDSFGIESFIQTDAAINPGNSGGALVNLQGELVGIATAIATESGSYEGYGFAVPVNLMQRVIEDLIDFGQVQRGYLGVEIWAVDAERARELGLDPISGVYLADVRRGLSAHEAGLRSGDVLLAIDGRTVDEPNELQSAIALYRPGERVQVDVWRRGERRAFEVELLGRESPESQNWFAELSGRNEEESPSEMEVDPPDLDDEAVVSMQRWGFGVLELSQRYRRLFRVRAGVYVAYVEAGSVADQAGLPRHAVLTRVNGSPVDTGDDVRRALQEAAEQGVAALCEIRRGDGSLAYFEIEPPTSSAP